MKHILLVDLFLGLSRLLDPERWKSGDYAGLAALAAKSHAWGLVEPDLREQLAALEALPEGVARAPLAEELGVADGLFDGIGRAVRALLDAHIGHPRIDPETRATLVRLRDTFVPELSLFTSTYLDEGRLARDLDKILGEHEAAARSVPVAFGGTLYDWLSDFIAQGLVILELLERRAQALASISKEDRRRASALRTSMIEALGVLRDGLNRESLRDPAMGALAPALLGFFDMMETTRTPASKSAAPPGEAQPEAPAAPAPTEVPAIA